MNKLVIACLFPMVTLLSACGGGTPAGQTASSIAVGEPSPSKPGLPKDGTTLAFEILRQSPFTAIDDERTVLATDTAAFEKLWNEVHLNLSSIHLPPKIDFTKKMVVGVFTGKQLHGCRSVTVGRAGIEAGKLAVEYDDRVVQWSSAPCKAEYTSPGTLAVLDRLDVQAVFSRIVPQPLAFSRVETSLDSTDVNRPPATAVVKDAASWAALWTRYSIAGTPLPPVDFSKSMVLFAFYGVASGCDGNKLEEVARVNGKLYVTSTYTPPGPNAVCVAAFLARGNMVTVERSEEPVVFIDKRMPAPTI